MKLSIIVPIYNVEKYIEKCLLSIVVAAKGYQEQLEVILVDDGSSDRSSNIADDYADRYMFVRVIHQANCGVAKARNNGLRDAAGEYVWFVDSDDEVTSQSIEAILQAASDGRQDVLIFDAIESAGGHNRPWKHEGLSKLLHEAATQDRCKDTTQIPTIGRQLAARVLYAPIAGGSTPFGASWDKVYRRKFLLDNGLGFKETLKVLDDMFFNFEIFMASPKAAYVGEAIYIYHRIVGSITNRYYEDRLSEDRQVWAALKDRLADYEETVLWQAFYLRIIKSFCICCRLSLLHKNNCRSLGAKLASVKNTLELPEYEQAFKNVKPGYAEWKLKWVIFFARRKNVFGIYLLNLAQRLLQ